MRRSLLPLFALTFLAHPLAAQATATTCKDGSSSAASGRGACSGHGGVDKAATKRAEQAVKAEQKAAVRGAATTGAQVTCTDGSMSNSGRGACSHHGGVRVAGATVSRAPMAPQLPASVPETSPSRTRARAQSQAPSATVAASSHQGEDNDPTGAIAQCKDGLYSHSANRRGACSRHHGVAKWMQ